MGILLAWEHRIHPKKFVPTNLTLEGMNSRCRQKIFPQKISRIWARFFLPVDGVDVSKVYISGVLSETWGPSYFSWVSIPSKRVLPVQTGVTYYRAHQTRGLKVWLSPKTETKTGTKTETLKADKIVVATLRQAIQPMESFHCGIVPWRQRCFRAMPSTISSRLGWGCLLPKVNHHKIRFFYQIFEPHKLKLVYPLILNVNGVWLFNSSQRGKLLSPFSDSNQAPRNNDFPVSPRLVFLLCVLFFFLFIIQAAEDHTPLTNASSQSVKYKRDCLHTVSHPPQHAPPFLFPQLTCFQPSTLHSIPPAPIVASISSVVMQRGGLRMTVLIFFSSRATVFQFYSLPFLALAAWLQIQPPQVHPHERNRLIRCPRCWTEAFRYADCTLRQLTHFFITGCGCALPPWSMIGCVGRTFCTWHQIIFWFTDWIKYFA